MKLSKNSNNQRPDGKKPIDWLSFITDDRAKLAIPVGPRFQVDIPSWNPSCSKTRITIGAKESDDESKWLGTPIWPLKGRGQTTHHDIVGRGRPRNCTCVFPGSIECVKRHVSDKRLKLKIELGPAFWKWRFDVMGEDVSKVWNREEQRKFDYIMKKNLFATSFVKVALQCFPCQTKGSIVSYYLNVYIPRRMSVQTRSSCKFVETDDDDNGDVVDDDDINNDYDNNDDDGEDVLHSMVSLKRLHDDDFNSSTRKYLKTAYLASCR